MMQEIGLLDAPDPVPGGKKRVRVNAALYADRLRRFGDEKSLAEAQRIQVLISQRQHDRDTYVGNLLVQMHGKCGCMQDAEAAFQRIYKPNVFSFNLLIAGYLRNDDSAKALDTFDRMLESGSVAPDAYTFSNAAIACLKLRNLSRGEELHEKFWCSSFGNSTVVENSLLGMYSRCGSVDRARQLFDGMLSRDLVSWNTMLAAYAQSGHSSQALALYSKMLEQGIQPDDFTYSSLLSACSRFRSSDLRSQASAILRNSMASSSVVVKNAAVNLLARCASLGSAKKKFDELGLDRNEVSWNSMIAAFAEHGEQDQAVVLYREMQVEAVRPNEITFMSILRACSHAGELEQAIRSFTCMQHDHSLPVPLQQQYRCVVDVLGRAGWLDKAEEFISETQELERDSTAWLTLLGACSIHRDVERGIQVANRVVKLGPNENAIAALVLLSNIFAVVGRWEDFAKVKQVIDRHQKNN